MTYNVNITKHKNQEIYCCSVNSNNIKTRKYFFLHSDEAKKHFSDPSAEEAVKKLAIKKFQQFYKIEEYGQTNPES